jgi:hypothetical protein
MGRTRITDFFNSRLNMVGKASKTLRKLLAGLEGASGDEDLGDFSLDKAGQDEELSEDIEGSEDSYEVGATSGIRGVGTARQAHVSYERYSLMERRATSLMHDLKSLQTRHQAYVSRSEAEIQELRAGLKSAVQEMKERQMEIESKAPVLRAKLEDYRDRLQDLRISETTYQDLKAAQSQDPLSLNPLDIVKLASYEQSREVTREAETLRLALSSSREAASRLEQDVLRLKAESSRLAATLSEREREVQEASEVQQGRIQRLSSELEQALVRTEMNHAKSQMYDDLRVKKESLEAEVNRLLVVEASHKRLEAHASDAERAHRQREHAMEMLQMDKAYLTKQAEFMAEGQRKLQGELEMREAQVQELQRARTEMYDRLMAAEGGKARSDEARLQKELAQLQASTHADLERIRLDTQETYEREARLLREIRDQALEEAGRMRIAHQDIKGIYEKSVAAAAEVQRKLETQVIELQAELKSRAFELAHTRVVMGEKESLLAQSQAQVDLLQDRVQVMRDRVKELEVQEVSKRGLLSSPDIGTARDQLGGAVQAGGNQGTFLSAVDQSFEVEMLKKEKERLQLEVVRLLKALQECRASLDAVGQPHSFLLAQLSAAKAKADEVTKKLEAAESRVATLERSSSELGSENGALKRDLEILLQQRSSLDSMKKLVARTLGIGGAAPLPPQSGVMITGSGTTILS